MSAFSGPLGQAYQPEGRHGELPEGGSGAGDEATRSHFASLGQEDYLGAGRRDYRDPGSADATLETTLRRIRLRRAVRPSLRETQPEARASGDGGTDPAAVSAALRGFQRAALPREAVRATPHSAELHVGEAGSADRGVGEKEPQAWGTSTTAAASPTTRDVVAFGRQLPRLVSGPPPVRLAGASGRCYQRDLLRAVGGRGVYRYGDDGPAGGDRAERGLLRAVQRSRQPFLSHPESRTPGRSPATHAGGTSTSGIGDSNDSGLLAASSGKERTKLRHLAGAATPGTAGAGDPQRGRSE